MKVTKDEGDLRLGIYQPEESEQELLGDLSDKIIDIMEDAKLEYHQEIFLLDAMAKGIAEANGIINFESSLNHGKVSK